MDIRQYAQRHHFCKLSQNTYFRVHLRSAKKEYAGVGTAWTDDH